MSCHVVNVETPSVIVSYMRSEYVSEEICQATAFELHKENVEAWNHRYEKMMQPQKDWSYKTSLKVAPAQVYGCMCYLAYQILDHKNYAFLPGLALLEKLQARILAELDMTDSQIRDLPEYTCGM